MTPLQLETGEYMYTVQRDRSTSEAETVLQVSILTTLGITLLVAEFS